MPESRTVFPCLGTVDRRDGCIERRLKRKAARKRCLGLVDGAQRDVPPKDVEAGEGPARREPAGYEGNGRGGLPPAAAPVYRLGGKRALLLSEGDAFKVFPAIDRGRGAALAPAARMSAVCRGVDERQVRLTADATLAKRYTNPQQKQPHKRKSHPLPPGDQHTPSPTAAIRPAIRTADARASPPRSVHFHPPSADHSPHPSNSRALAVILQFAGVSDTVLNEPCKQHTGTFYTGEAPFWCVSPFALFQTYKGLPDIGAPWVPLPCRLSDALEAAFRSRTALLEVEDTDRFFDGSLAESTAGGESVSPLGGASEVDDGQGSPYSTERDLNSPAAAAAASEAKFSQQSSCRDIRTANPERNGAAGKPGGGGLEKQPTDAGSERGFSHGGCRDTAALEAPGSEAQVLLNGEVQVDRQDPTAPNTAAEANFRAPHANSVLLNGELQIRQESAPPNAASETHGLAPGVDSEPQIMLNGELQIRQDPTSRHTTSEAEVHAPNADSEPQIMLNGELQIRQDPTLRRTTSEAEVHAPNPDTEPPVLLVGELEIREDPTSLRTASEAKAHAPNTAPEPQDIELQIRHDPPPLHTTSDTQNPDAEPPVLSNAEPQVRRQAAAPLPSPAAPAHHDAAAGIARGSPGGSTAPDRAGEGGPGGGRVVSPSEGPGGHVVSPSEGPGGAAEEKKKQQNKLVVDMKELFLVTDRGDVYFLKRATAPVQKFALVSDKPAADAPPPSPARAASRSHRSMSGLLASARADAAGESRAVPWFGCSSSQTPSPGGGLSGRTPDSAHPADRKTGRRASPGLGSRVALGSAGRTAQSAGSDAVGQSPPVADRSTSGLGSRSSHSLNRLVETAPAVTSDAAGHSPPAADRSTSGLGSHSSHSLNRLADTAPDVTSDAVGQSSPAADRSTSGLGSCSSHSLNRLAETSTSDALGQSPPAAGRSLNRLAETAPVVTSTSEALNQSPPAAGRSTSGFGSRSNHSLNRLAETAPDVTSTSDALGQSPPAAGRSLSGLGSRSCHSLNRSAPDAQQSDTDGGALGVWTRSYHTLSGLRSAPPDAGLDGTHLGGAASASHRSLAGLRSVRVPRVVELSAESNAKLTKAFIGWQVHLPGKPDAGGGAGKGASVVVSVVEGFEIDIARGVSVNGGYTLVHRGIGLTAHDASPQSAEIPRLRSSRGLGQEPGRDTDRAEPCVRSPGPEARGCRTPASTPGKPAVLPPIRSESGHAVKTLQGGGRGEAPGAKRRAGDAVTLFEAAALLYNEDMLAWRATREGERQLCWDVRRLAYASEVCFLAAEARLRRGVRSAERGARGGIVAGLDKALCELSLREDRRVRLARRERRKAAEAERRELRARQVRAVHQEQRAAVWAERVALQRGVLLEEANALEFGCRGCLVAAELADRKKIAMAAKVSIAKQIADVKSRQREQAERLVPILAVEDDERRERADLRATQASDHHALLAALDREISITRQKAISAIEAYHERVNAFILKQSVERQDHDNDETSARASVRDECSSALAALQQEAFASHKKASAALKRRQDQQQAEVDQVHFAVRFRFEALEQDPRRAIEQAEEAAAAEVHRWQAASYRQAIRPFVLSLRGDDARKGKNPAEVQPVASGDSPPGEGGGVHVREAEWIAGQFETALPTTLAPDICVKRQSSVWAPLSDGRVQAAAVTVTPVVADAFSMSLSASTRSRGPGDHAPLKDRRKRFASLHQVAIVDSLQTPRGSSQARTPQPSGNPRRPSEGRARSRSVASTDPQQAKRRSRTASMAAAPHRQGSQRLSAAPLPSQGSCSADVLSVIATATRQLSVSGDTIHRNRRAIGTMMTSDVRQNARYAASLAKGVTVTPPEVLNNALPPLPPGALRIHFLPGVPRSGALGSDCGSQGESVHSDQAPGGKRKPPPAPSLPGLEEILVEDIQHVLRNVGYSCEEKAEELARDSIEYTITMHLLIEDVTVDLEGGLASEEVPPLATDDVFHGVEAGIPGPTFALPASRPAFAFFTTVNRNPVVRLSPPLLAFPVASDLQTCHVVKYKFEQEAFAVGAVYRPSVPIMQAVTMPHEAQASSSKHDDDRPFSELSASMADTAGECSLSLLAPPSLHAAPASRRPQRFFDGGFLCIRCTTYGNFHLEDVVYVQDGPVPGDHPRAPAIELWPEARAKDGAAAGVGRELHANESCQIYKLLEDGAEVAAARRAKLSEPQRQRGVLFACFFEPADAKVGLQRGASRKGAEAEQAASEPAELVWSEERVRVFLTRVCFTNIAPVPMRGKRSLEIVLAAEPCEGESRRFSLKMLSALPSLSTATVVDVIPLCDENPTFWYINQDSGPSPFCIYRGADRTGAPPAMLPALAPPPTLLAKDASVLNTQGVRTFAADIGYISAEIIAGGTSGDRLLVAPTDKIAVDDSQAADAGANDFGDLPGDAPVYITYDAQPVGVCSYVAPSTSDFSESNGGEGSLQHLRVDFVGVPELAVVRDLVRALAYQSDAARPQLGPRRVALVLVLVDERDEYRRDENRAEIELRVLPPAVKGHVTGGELATFQYVEGQDWRKVPHFELHPAPLNPPAEAKSRSKATEADGAAASALSPHPPYVPLPENLMFYDGGKLTLSFFDEATVEAADQLSFMYPATSSCCVKKTADGGAVYLKGGPGMQEEMAMAAWFVQPESGQPLVVHLGATHQRVFSLGFTGQGPGPSGEDEAPASRGAAGNQPLLELRGFGQAKPKVYAKQLKTLLQGLHYRSVSKDPMILVKTLKLEVEDAFCSVSTAATQLTIQPVNDPTDITLAYPRLLYRQGTESAKSFLICPNATLFDVDTTETSAGSLLVVELVTGSPATDIIGLHHVPEEETDPVPEPGGWGETGKPRITLDGKNVHVDGVKVAVVSKNGKDKATRLQTFAISINPGVQLTTCTNLIQALSFSSSVARAGVRILAVKFNAGDGVSDSKARVEIDVQPATIAAPPYGSKLNYKEGSGPVVVNPKLACSFAGVSTFAGSRFVVQIAEGFLKQEDVIAMGDSNSFDIDLSAGKVRGPKGGKPGAKKVVVGTYTVSDDGGTHAIEFNDAMADVAALSKSVQALARSVRYCNTSNDPSDAKRRLDISLCLSVDALSHWPFQGATTCTAETVVNVIPVDDKTDVVPRYEAVRFVAEHTHVHPNPGLLAHAALATAALGAPANPRTPATTPRGADADRSGKPRVCAKPPGGPWGGTLPFEECHVDDPDTHFFHLPHSYLVVELRQGQATGEIPHVGLDTVYFDVPEAQRLLEAAPEEEAETGEEPFLAVTYEAAEGGSLIAHRGKVVGKIRSFDNSPAARGVGGACPAAEAGPAFGPQPVHDWYAALNPHTLFVELYGCPLHVVRALIRSVSVHCRPGAPGVGFRGRVARFALRVAVKGDRGPSAPTRAKVLLSVAPPVFEAHPWFHESLARFVYLAHDAAAALPAVSSLPAWVAEKQRASPPLPPNGDATEGSLRAANGDDPSVCTVAGNPDQNARAALASEETPRIVSGNPNQNVHAAATSEDTSRIVSGNPDQGQAAPDAPANEGIPRTVSSNPDGNARASSLKAAAPAEDTGRDDTDAFGSPDQGAPANEGISRTASGSPDLNASTHASSFKGGASAEDAGRDNTGALGSPDQGDAAARQPSGTHAQAPASTDTMEPQQGGGGATDTAAPPSDTKAAGKLAGKQLPDPPGGTAQQYQEVVPLAAKLSFSPQVTSFARFVFEFSFAAGDPTESAAPSWSSARYTANRPPDPIDSLFSHADGGFIPKTSYHTTPFSTPLNSRVSTSAAAADAGDGAPGGKLQGSQPGSPSAGGGKLRPLQQLFPALSSTPGLSAAPVDDSMHQSVTEALRKVDRALACEPAASDHLFMSLPDGFRLTRGASQQMSIVCDKDKVASIEQGVATAARAHSLRITFSKNLRLSRTQVLDIVKGVHYGRAVDAAGLPQPQREHAAFRRLFVHITAAQPMPDATVALTSSLACLLLKSVPETRTTT